ncbi:hypothetical protein Aduo_011786 [Ancylostoma duodenale]
MLPFHTLLFAPLLFPCISSYKMVLFVPDMANSQVLFNSRVAEALAKAGHEVTMVMISGMSDFDSKDVKIMKEVKLYRVNASFGMSRSELQERQSKIIFKDIPMWDSRVRENLKQMTGLLIKSCRKLVENREFLRWLAAERFDLAFSHMYDICPIGLIHYAKIPSWIWLNSGALMDFVAYYMGVPIIPSYMPPIAMESSDHMNFLERTKSLIGHTLTSLLWKRLFADGETAIFRELIDPNFPDIVDVAKECPLVMVNSNELYDLPRPTLAKIVNIGGIGIQLKDARPLSPEFQRIVDAAEGIVVFSFGSVAPSHKMPMNWKMAFVDAFKRFPRYHFIWRYEGPDLQDEIPPNVHIFKWLPQSDLLQNPKTKAFLSHGGYNSMQEAISAGVPLITIALFGDQPKNAKLAERHQFSVNLHKGDLSADTIADALNKLFEDPSYSQKIKRLSKMARKKPMMRLFMLFLMAYTTYSYKMVIFVLDLSNSQLLFNERVAEALADAGHDVTIALIVPQSDLDNSDIKIKGNVKTHVVNAPINLTRKAMEEQMEEYVFKESNGKMFAKLSLQISLILDTCQATLENKELLPWLKKEKFDLAFAHMFDVCTVGLVHAAKIPSWIWLNSGSVIDYVANLVGIPLIPSYVPPIMMAAAGEMDFLQRTKSLIGHGLVKVFWKRLIADPETVLFRTHVSPDFPNLLELAAKCPLVMANTNELYEAARPTLAKVVNIGGIGMEVKDLKPLPKQIADIVSAGGITVLFSFGSVFSAHRMPLEMKKTFLETFRRFPKYQFLWRYEKDDIKDMLPRNVHLFKWLPQSDLLRHPRTKVFITHGGYNSIQIKMDFFHSVFPFRSGVCLVNPSTPTCPVMCLVGINPS